MSRTVTAHAGFLCIHYGKGKVKRARNPPVYLNTGTGWDPGSVLYKTGAATQGIRRTLTTGVGVLNVGLGIVMNLSSMFRLFLAFIGVCRLIEQTMGGTMKKETLDGWPPEQIRETNKRTWR